MLLSAFAEVVSLGAVLPFLGILIAPDKVFSYPIVADLVLVLGVTSADQLVLPLTVAFTAAALIAAVIRILLLWVSTRLAYATGADLSIDVYRRTLYQPYQVHLARNSSEVINGIINKVSGITFGVMMSSLSLVSSTVLLVAVMLALISIDPMVASVTAVGFGASYALITWLARNILKRNSQRIAYEQTQVVKALQEGLGGIRDVLLNSTQPVYCDIYRQADYPLRRAQGSTVFIGGSPRPIMEALGMVLIAALSYVLSRQGGIVTALPMLGALALGAQRLLPAMQQIYSSWAIIKGSHASLADTIELLDQPVPAELLQPTPAPLILEDTIHFDAVRFRYTSDGPWVLNGLNIAIPKGARVGFVGSTGSGKSTTLDLLMGLLTPTEGELLLDGDPVKGNRLRAWQQTIAHVPQSIYLADTSLAENIAFGVPRDAIDLNQVQKAARQAQIADFIESRPDGYNVYVGERGIRLSGGQRQRIGIARALYKQARVLVFDEATSALDNATEQSVMDAIEGLSRDLTILLIAHRLTTVRRCDIVVQLENGKVVAQGTYEHLIKCSPSFRKMAET
ncbi:ABC transporter ATP-binding protein [Alphaproteobacteria bacterium]|nr:ABC transporter ATP-binding protein [Alphaproteobacteria bacterium]